MNPLRVAALVVVVIVLIVLGVSIGSLIEINDAGHIIVIQYPRGGMRVGFDPGPYPQWWGTVTKYPKRDQFFFTCKSKEADHSLRVTFNDGGAAKVCGQIAWEMPSTEQHVLDLHFKYRSHEAVEQQLVRPSIAKSVTFSGPLMSSTESYAARKSDLLNFIEDQIKGGVYKTESIQKREKDVWGVERTVTLVTILKNDKGLSLRQDDSPLDDFGIKTFGLAIDEILYDQTVANQIQQQQAAFAQVATAVARAKEAEQQAITAEKQGQAKAAEAKWQQEVIKAQQVTEAQMRKEVAELDAAAAAATKRQQILLGEGESERRKLVMAADGSLDKKLETYERVQALWAQAFKDYKGGPLVPQIVTGSGGQASGGNAALDFMQIMGMKAAKDLAVDVNQKR
jgi:hypothetical protein